MVTETGDMSRAQPTAPSLIDGYEAWERYFRAMATWRRCYKWEGTAAFPTWHGITHEFMMLDDFHPEEMGW